MYEMNAIQKFREKKSIGNENEYLLYFKAFNVRLYVIFATKRVTMVLLFEFLGLHDCYTFKIKFIRIYKITNFYVYKFSNCRDHEMRKEPETSTCLCYNHVTTYKLKYSRFKIRK